MKRVNADIRNMKYLQNEDIIIIYYRYLFGLTRDRKDSRVEKIIQVDMNLKSNCIYLSIVYALCIRANLKPVAF